MCVIIVARALKAKNWKPNVSQRGFAVQTLAAKAQDANRMLIKVQPVKHFNNKQNSQYH